MAILPFLILSGVILAAGPGLNEGGFQALKEHKLKAFEQAWDERKPYDSGTLKNSKTGNFGND